MRRGIAITIALFASPVSAQVSYPPPDTTNLATKSDVAGVQAAIPPVCATAPSGDTLNGTTGTAGAACTPPINNTRPTSVQAGNTTLAANCSFSVTFARSFTSTTPFVYAAVVDSSGNQMPCKAQTRSATGFTGICAPANSTAISLSIVTTGLTVTPFGTTCAVGTPVMFVGREPTQ